jgi:serine-type D-Ala-D-Ala carboxypeptidase (penicillin-binding protein 5/6)
MEGANPEKRKGPAHARGRTLPQGNEERLADLGKQVPPSGDDELEIIARLRSSRRRRRLFGWATTLVVLALLAGAIAQWVRPLPSVTVHTVSVRFPGAAPTFAWPTTGEAAATVEGIGVLGQVRGSQPVPVAGLADVLTAYVVLSDHRLSPGDDGPSIPVTSDTITAYQAGLASQQSEIPVAAGESLTELQALEGLMINSGADMATLLAVWDAGSTNAFVAKMNTVAGKLGLSATHITDPSGVDPATTSTAEDLVRLGEAALSIPVLQQIVSLGQTSVPIPMAPVVYNLNFDLGQDGIIGIDSGSDSSAQGCYLVAAQQTIGGKTVTVVGAVLGQPGGALGPNTAAVDAGDALVKSAFAALHSFTVFTPGQQAGRVEAPWGAAAPVTVALPISLVGWPGLTVTLAARPAAVHGALPAGARAGTLFAAVGRKSSQVELRTEGQLAAPGLWWRLTR